ncbi:hypothetical protein, partial [Candidatus Avelusimicrobium fimicolum]|uniref:hypothetical protein n=1 Tax=Candidatus Avelusimicrobium fimicolum TaxID=3416216 RepID=UPI003D0C45CC
MYSAESVPYCLAIQAAKSLTLSEQQSSSVTHSSAVLSHVPHSPGSHSPVVLSHVTVRVCVPQLLHSWLLAGCVPVQAQLSEMEHALHALQVPVVVSQVLVCVPPFLHPHACVEEPSQVFG